MSHVLVHTMTAMGTVITIQVVGEGSTLDDRRARSTAVERAAAWFDHVNNTCTRFDPGSELRRLTTRIGQPVTVSPLLFQAVQFALRVADASGGAFDPTVGAELESRGFDAEYRSGKSARAGIAPTQGVRFTDVELDPAHLTITLRRPLTLDLGGCAKGLAIDLAAKELQEYPNIGIDAGGDLYLRGQNAERMPWTVGIRHPRQKDRTWTTIAVADGAVCTSGDYERTGRESSGAHHLIDARTNTTATELLSATVLAPSAMVADALATAAFALGPTDGLAFLEQQGVEGLLVDHNLAEHVTPGFVHA